MKLNWGHLCDYLFYDANGKPCIIGEFNVFAGAVDPTTRSVRINTLFGIVCNIEADPMDPAYSDIAVRMLDGDGNEQLVFTRQAVPFARTHPGAPITTTVSFPGIVCEYNFPEEGGYSFEIAVARAGGYIRLGEIPFFVIDSTTIRK